VGIGAPGVPCGQQGVQATGRITSPGKPPGVFQELGEARGVLGRVTDDAVLLRPRQVHARGVAGTDEVPALQHVRAVAPLLDGDLKDPAAQPLLMLVVLLELGFADRLGIQAAPLLGLAD
jgi:hypothetical protein